MLNQPCPSPFPLNYPTKLFHVSGAEEAFSSRPPGNTFILQSTSCYPHTVSIITVFAVLIFHLLMYILHYHVLIYKPYLPTGLESFEDEGPYLISQLPSLIPGWSSIDVCCYRKENKVPIMLHWEKFHPTKMHVKYQPWLYKWTLRLRISWSLNFFIQWWSYGHLCTALYCLYPYSWLTQLHLLFIIRHT